jgi:AcrR family transcriptional regulator
VQTFLQHLNDRDLSKGKRARHSLLTAAVRVFGRQPFEAATTREIAQEAGQNIAAISYYFGGKQGLYLAFIEEVGHYVEALLAESLKGAGDFLAEVGAGACDATDAQKEAAVGHLASIIYTMAQSIVLEEESQDIHQVLMRELMQPSEGFSVFYRIVIQPLHETIARLLGVILGASPESPSVLIHTHATIGEVHIFRTGRETFLRRTGSEDLTGFSESIPETLRSRFEIFLKSLRENHAATVATD